MAKFSKLYVPGLREVPKDATLPNHILLVHTDFVEQAGNGLYNLLPLGKRALDRIRNIVKGEMDKAGAQEVNLSFITPASLWQESGRYNIFGRELLRFKDRKENEFVLGPAHEGTMLSLIGNKITSYKQLPLYLYRIRLKFRDEARPRFGLLRCHEFLVKNGYSFHVNEENLGRGFELMYKTYS